MAEIAQEALVEQQKLGSRLHFEVMDGLRGVAAMAVVLLHSFQGGGLVVNGQLAVDLFFLLSGFVIAYSYDEKLRSGMKISDFLAKRFIRLYPMVFVGALGGVLIALIHNKTNSSEAYPLGSLIMSGGLSMVVLPYVGHAIGDKIFSFNPPLWSLFFELVANIAYVVFARKLNNFVVLGVVALGLLGIVVGGALGGGSKATILLGLPRVMCGFFGGVLIYRNWQRGAFPRMNGRFVILAPAIFAIFCCPIMIGGWAYLPIYLIFVMVIVLAAGAKPSPADKYCALLGEVSYPLYLIHWLTLYVFTWVGTKIGLSGANYGILATAHWICAPVIAYFVARYYELPSRKLLTRLWIAFKRRSDERSAGPEAVTVEP